MSVEPDPGASFEEILYDRIDSEFPEGHTARDYRIALWTYNYVDLWHRFVPQLQRLCGVWCDSQRPHRIGDVVEIPVNGKPRRALRTFSPLFESEGQRRSNWSLHQIEPSEAPFWPWCGDCRIIYPNEIRAISTPGYDLLNTKPGGAIQIETGRIPLGRRSV
jgi:hypothetical protein